MTQQQVDLQRLLMLEQQQKDYQGLEIPEMIIPETNIQIPLLETVKSLEKELNQNIYSNDNVTRIISKKRQRSRSATNRYSSTKVKARNFLSIVSYNRIKKNDYENRSFVIDCFSFLLLYLNPFYLERKFKSEIERDYVNMLRSYLMPGTLYNFICRDDNFKILNKVKLKFNQANEIIKLFIEDETISSQKQQFDTLKNYLIENAKLYQFVYANLFPRCFARVDNYGVQLKTKFNVHYKNYLNQKNIFEWYQKNSVVSEEKNEENTSANSTPLNMTKVNEKEEEIVEVEVITQKENVKKEDEVVDDIATPLIENSKQKKKKAAKEVVLTKLNKEEKKENKKNKLEMSAEKKKQKRNEKKRKLEKQLFENTEKIQKIKKINKKQ